MARADFRRKHTRQKTMRHITKLIACILVLCGPIGCKTSLEPGSYLGDQLLFDADTTLTTSFAIVDATLKWERDNRELLSSIPEIKQICDTIRAKAPAAFKAAFKARDAYEQSSTQANATTLDITLTTIRALANEASSLLTTFAQ
jgi:hypothetical protein